MRALALRGKPIQIKALYPDRVYAHGWLWIEEWLTPYKRYALKQYFGL